MRLAVRSLSFPSTRPSARVSRHLGAEPSGIPLHLAGRPLFLRPPVFVTCSFASCLGDRYWWEVLGVRLGEPLATLAGIVPGTSTALSLQGAAVPSGQAPPSKQSSTRHPVV